MATLASIADFGGLESLRERIDELWERRAELDDRDPAVQASVLSVIELLDRGRLRVAAVGRDAIEHEATDRARAVEETSGALSGVYAPGELERLREDWPE